MLWAKYDRTCAAVVGTQTIISICWLNHLYLLETCYINFDCTISGTAKIEPSSARNVQSWLHWRLAIH